LRIYSYGLLFTDTYWATLKTPVLIIQQAPPKTSVFRGFPILYLYRENDFMEYATIQITVPKDMKTYFTDNYSGESNEELERNALLLYPYVYKKVISHGRAAEILGIKKLDLIDLYDDMGFPYFDMDITDVMQDIQTFHSLKKIKP